MIIHGARGMGGISDFICVGDGARLNEAALAQAPEDAARDDLPGRLRNAGALEQEDLDLRAVERAEARYESGRLCSGWRGFRRFRGFDLRFYVLEWVRADYAFADSAAATCNTIFPGLWPANPCSKASRALASSSTAPTTTRSVPLSIS